MSAHNEEDLKPLTLWFVTSVLFYFLIRRYFVPPFSSSASVVLLFGLVFVSLGARGTLSGLAKHDSSRSKPPERPHGRFKVYIGGVKKFSDFPSTFFLLSYRQLRLRFFA